VSDSAIRLFDNRCTTYLPPEPAIGRPAPADASPSGGLVAGGACSGAYNANYVDVPLAVGLQATGELIGRRLPSHEEMRNDGEAGDIQEEGR
jgi:hypothetical protein